MIVVAPPKLYRADRFEVAAVILLKPLDKCCKIRASLCVSLVFVVSADYDNGDDSDNNDDGDDNDD